MCTKLVHVYRPSSVCSRDILTGIIPIEHLASGTDESRSIWRSLNRVIVEEGRCRSLLKCGTSLTQIYATVGETDSHLLTCGDAPNCPWANVGNPCRCQLCQTLGGVYLRVPNEDSTNKNWDIAELEGRWLPSSPQTHWDNNNVTRLTPDRSEQPESIALVAIAPMY